MEQLVAEIEAVWAKHHVHLASEPPGERFGMIPLGVSYAQPEAGDERPKPVTVTAVGDSMVAGCGVSDQRQGLVPDLARGVAKVAAKPVRWSAYGKLGATMRRVRYRLLPEIGGRSDILILCAGSNDIMARRSIDEWRDDLTASVDLARRHASRVVVLSAGQVHRCPALGRALRNSIGRLIDAQTAVTIEICESEHAAFVALTHAYDITAEAGFWAPDRFHPSRYGYERIADLVIGSITPVLHEMYGGKAL